MGYTLETRDKKVIINLEEDAMRYHFDCGHDQVAPEGSFVGDYMRCVTCGNDVRVMTKFTVLRMTGHGISTHDVEMKERPKKWKGKIYRLIKQGQSIPNQVVKGNIKIVNGEKDSDSK